MLMLRLIRYNILLILPLIFMGSGGCKSNETTDPGSPRSLGVRQDSPVEGSESPPSSSEKGKPCARCHEDHYTLWADGGHSGVSCRFCHGAAEDHMRNDVEPRPDMELPGGADLCLSCHSELESLEAHVKYVGEKHSVTTDIEKTKGRCIFCHDPHSLE